MNKNKNEVKNVTTEQLVIKGPIKLKSVTISGDGANADCDIYDGVNTTGEKKCHLETLSGTSFQFTIKESLEMKRGIYVVVNAATTNVMLEYGPE